MTVRPFFRPALVLLIALHGAIASAENTPRNLSDDYHDLERCMERTMGRRWAEHFRVKQVVNAYGVLEATEDAVDTAPQVVRITDMNCRLQVGLQEQLRPTTH